MTALFATLLLTTAVAASVGLGILSAYVVMLGVFRVFGRPAQAAPQPQRQRLVLVPTEAHASGD